MYIQDQNQNNYYKEFRIYNRLSLNLEIKEKIKKIFEQINFNEIEEFCQNNHISSLKLFGSILTENFKETSDIDILIDFEPDNIPGFFTYEDLQFKLSEIFNNRKVDLRTKNELSPYFREKVLDQAVKIYG